MESSAQNLIYIDFECLKTTPPHPALLGVLIGGVEDGVEQLILDDRLAPAQRAHARGTRVTPASDAVEAIVNLARVDDVGIAGWSNFDRDRLIEIRPDLAGEIRARYVNALTIARPWRIKVHPSFPIEREDQFSPKHTLDKYAVLAGYPHAHKLAGATPAKWIRHTIGQLKATGGSYRRTTHETKRDWHALLKYNAHDLLALRHIVLRASRELECWRAFERTTFCVQPSEGTRRPGRICFKAGSRSRKVDMLLARRHASRWAFITAWNPGSIRLPQPTNDHRHAELMATLEGLGLETLPGEGVGEDPAWAPEKSVMVLGISPGKAVSIGRHFGQLAIVVGRRGEAPRLVSTDRAGSGAGSG